MSGWHRVVSGLGRRRELVPPGVPQLTKPMQQQNQGPCRFVRANYGVCQVRQRVISDDDDASRQVWSAFEGRRTRTEERRRLPA
jgi:hypothetical protein